MTRQVLILGNSHLAALREAWTDNPGRWPGHELRFVGGHGDLLMQTRIEDGMLRPATPAAAEAFRRFGGGTGVALDRADAVVIAGCAVSLAQSAALWKEARWPGLPSLNRAANLATLPQTVMSRAAVRAGVVGRLEARLGLQLLRHLRPAVRGGLWLVSQPRMSAIVRRRRHPAAASVRAAEAAQDGPALSALHDEAAALAVARAGAGYRPQPAATIEAALYTALPFVVGAKRLTASGRQEQPPTDVLHANAAYGTAVLDDLLAAI